MRRYYFLLTFLLLCASLSWSQTTVTVTGNLGDILGTNVTTNAKVCFSLIDALGNPIQDPRTSGNVLISTDTVCTVPNGSGVFTTSVVPNDLITPANSQYSVQEYLRGSYVHGDNFTFNSTTPTYNLNTATPNSTSSLPVVPQPSSGGTTQRCIFTNAVSTWTCTENMGTTAVMAFFQDSNGVQIFPDKSQATDVNTYVGTWLQPQAGSMTVYNVGQWTPSTQFPNYIIANPTSSQTITGQVLHANGGLAVDGDVATTLGGSLSAKRILGCSTVYAGGPFANIQAAVSDAGTTGCVLILGSYTGVDTYTNPNNVNVIDLRSSIFSVTHAGVFTNTQMNMYLQSLLNGVNPATEYQGAQGSQVDTEAGTFGIAIPNTSTVHQASALAAYVNNSSPNTNAAAVYPSAHCSAANTACWPINPIAFDSANAGIKLLNEFDYNVSNAGTQISGLATGVFTAQPATATAWEVGKPSGGGLWTQGFMCDAGATLAGNGYSCVKIQPIASGVNQQSQETTYVSNDPVSGTHIANTFEDANGNFWLSASGVFNSPSQIVGNSSTNLTRWTPSDDTAGTAVYLTNHANSVVEFGLNKNGTFGNYGGTATAGQGVSWIPGATSQKSETGSADANVLTYTPPASVGTYRACFTASVSSATAGVIAWTLSYKNSNGVAQTNDTMPLTQQGTAAPNTTFTTSAAGEYQGCWQFDIDNSATAIVAKWVGGGTTAAKVSVTIERLQ